MAHFYPNKEALERKEEALYKELSNLDDSFYVCYEPIQFMRKNLVLILRKEVGLFILKIADKIDFCNYYKALNKYEDDDSIKKQINNALINRLKVDADHFFYDICPNAGIIINKEERAYGCVKVGYWLKKQERDIPILKYVPIWGKGATAGYISNKIKEILKPHNFYESKEITRFAQELFFPDKSNSPSNVNNLNVIQNTDKSHKIFLTKDQEIYINNLGDTHQRVSGSAGTGKTIIGAYRAIDRVKNHNEHVLYLYYNITLKGYIEDKIRSLAPQGSEGASILSNILVIHLDGFKKFINIKKDLEITINGLADPIKICSFEEEFLDNSFETIIVDETQDLETKDFTLIHELFPDSVFLFLGDFSQNIYLRKWYDPLKKENNTGERTQKPALRGFGFVGKWKILDKGFRSVFDLNEKIIDFCNKFEIEGPQENKKDKKSDSSLFESIFIYHDTNLCLEKDADKPIQLGNYIQNKVIDEKTINKVYYFIKNIIGNNGFDAKDTVILSSQRDTLRSLQKIYDDEYESMVDTNINLSYVKDKYEIKDKNSYDRIVDSYDRLYKLTFNNNSNSIKFSTIYSYKGYEADNVIILLDTRIVVNDLADKQIQEKEWLEGRKKELALIYTAISRSRKNVVLIGFNDFCSDDIKKYFRDNFNYQCTDEYNNTMDFDIPF